MFGMKKIILASLLLTMASGKLKEPSAEDLEEALRFGRDYVANINRIEELLESHMDSNSVNTLINRFKPVDLKAVEESKKVAVHFKAREYLRAKGHRTELDTDLVEVVCSPATFRQTSCDPRYPFRSFDGSCNNLNQPKYGQAGTIFQRLGKPSYMDGVSAPRITDPSPRLVSVTVLVNDSRPTYDASLMTMQWGQFLDHDLTSTPTATTSNGDSISCCSSILIGKSLASPAHPECMPISIPTGDPAYGSQNCMNFVRSTYGSNLDGTISPNREQINSNTHWMDGSQVYGSSDSVAQNLRDKTAGKGLMKVSIQNGRTLLPLDTTCCPGDPTNTCSASASCFTAGDQRLIEQPLLTLMHTLWVREHNRIANGLSARFPGLTDEVYYQHARRLVIAELQHITYTEYLPVLIGRDLASRIMTSTTTNYRPNANPAIFNEFAGAAYRMGHSQLWGPIKLIQADGRKSNDSYLLSDSFFNASKLLQSTYIDNALRGLTRTNVQAVDNSFPEDVTSRLFKGLTGKGLGLDLVSLNIQRGRDHGLPPYVDMLTAALMDLFSRGIQNPANGFDSLNVTTTPEIIAFLRSIYKTVNDIDLYIGGVTENPMPDALLGPTFARIVYRQFDNLKHADRFFYDDLSQLGSFTPAQLDEIRKTSLARILCDNSDGTIDNIQPNVFRTPGLLNQPVPCMNIPGMDFTKFQPPPPTLPSSG